LYRELPGLQWLDLGLNQITAVGIAAIAAELKDNKQLKFLGLAQNPFNEDGLDHFIEIVQQGVLQKWQLSSTLFPPDEIARSFAMKFPGLSHFSGSWIQARSAAASPSFMDVPSLETKQRPEKPVTKISHRRLWGLRRPKAEPKCEDDLKISRKIDRALSKQHDQAAKRNGLIFGMGTSRLALFQDMVKAHDEIPVERRSEEANRVREFVLKCAQTLATAVPHYGCPMSCPVPLRGLCRGVIDSPVLDEKTATLIKAFWNQIEVRRALVASQRGFFAFPQQMTPLFDRVSVICKEDYVPETEDVLYWKDSENMVHEYSFFADRVPIRLLAGGRKLLKLIDEERGSLAIVIAATYLEMKNESIPVSKFNAVITYSDPPWTKEELQKLGGSMWYPTSTLAGVGEALKKISVSQSLESLGMMMVTAREGGSVHNSRSSGNDHNSRSSGTDHNSRSSGTDYSRNSGSANSRNEHSRSSSRGSRASNVQ